jgi:hypothetical protein
MKSNDSSGKSGEAQGGRSLTVTQGHPTSLVRRALDRDDR